MLRGSRRPADFWLRVSDARHWVRRCEPLSARVKNGELIVVLGRNNAQRESKSQSPRPFHSAWQAHPSPADACLWTFQDSPDFRM